MKKKMSGTPKKLLYALLGSSLFWYTPMIGHAAENATETGAVQGQVAKEEGEDIKDEQRKFSFPEVTVTAERDRSKPKDLPLIYAGGQVAKGARLGLLGNTNIMDTPFNITSYTAQTIDDQQARTVADVLINDPSVRLTTSNGHMNENYTIRGFGLIGWELGFNGMYGLAPYGHTPIEFFERVEVLKGPNALLNGMPPSGGVGGSINLVPKRADDQPMTRITTDYTSGSNLGTHLDLGRRFGANKEWGVRFNGVYRDGETGVDDQSKKSVLGALGLDYRSKRLRASLDTYNTEENSTNGAPLMVQFQSTGTGAVTSIPKAPNSSTNAFRGTFAKEENKGVVLHGDYDITDNLTAYVGLGTLHYDYAGFINGTQAQNVLANGNYTGTSTYIKGYSDTVSAETGLRGHFKTGAVDHQMVLSATSLHIKSGTNNTQVAYSSNIYNPVTYTLATEPAFVLQTEDTTLSGIALADTLSFAQDKYLLTLGGRNQRIQSKTWNNKTGLLTANYDESAVTPAIALVVKPWAAPVSLYANYIEGLSKGSTVTVLTAKNYGQVFAPFKSKQIETGIKWDGGTFTNTLSVFQITKPSMINDATTNTYNEDGEQRNRGAEWNVFGKINKDLRLLGGAAFTRGVQTNTANNLNEGKTAYGTPKWQANLGFEWDTPWKSGLTLNARAVYTSSQYADSANKLEMPSWTRYDIGARYATKVNGTPVTYRASVENVLNKNYWSGCFSDGYLTLSSGRTFKLSATIDM